VALQVEVKLGRVNYVAIYDGTRWAIPAPICVPGRREEANMVAFSYDNDSNLRSDSYFLACL